MNLLFSLYQLQFESNNYFLEQENDSSDENDSGNEINTYRRETAVQSLTKSLHSLGKSSVRLKIICKTNYTTAKVANSEGAVRKKIFSIPSDDGT
jgi:hypothetical protein